MAVNIGGSIAVLLKEKGLPYWGLPSGFKRETREQR